MGCDAGPDPIRLVGDPVDVVSGACVEVTCEFELRGPFPFTFRRHYDSSKRGLALSLGWGHTHEYDRTLAFVVDGLRYTMPLGRAVLFPPLLENGDEEVAQGRRLTRVNARLYRLRESDGSTAEFAFASTDVPARLQRLVRGEHALEFRYDPRGRLAGVVDSLGRYIVVETDDRGRLLSLALRGGEDRPERRLIAFAYDGAGHLFHGRDAYGNAFTFEYDERGRLSRRTDRRGYSFSYEYDDQDRCIRSAGSDGLHEVRLEYLPVESITKVTKADGGEWTYVYDEGGRVTQIIDPYGGATVFEVDEQGRVVREVDPAGTALDWVYDSSGAMLGKRSPFGELLADPETPVNPNARAHRVPRRPLECEYGDLLPLDHVSPPSPGAAALLHEVPQRARESIWTLPAASQSAGEEVGDQTVEGQRVYDPTGLRVLEHKPGSSPRRWVYDEGGNTRRFHDHDGAVHEYRYTSWDLREAHVDPVGGVTRYAYTAEGQIASVIDPGGTESEYEYDLKDRLVSVRRHGELREEYRYDAATNLVEKLDGNGEWLLRFEVEPGSLKATRQLASGGTHSFEYDDHGRYTTVATDDVEVTFAYDPLGQVVADLRDRLGVQHRFRGLRELEQTTVLKRFVIGYRREADGALVVVDPTGGEHRIDLPGNGLVHRTFSNGSRETAQFDPDGRCRMRHVEHARRGSWTRRYQYSGEGDLLDVQDDRHGRQRFEYDEAHRLRRTYDGEGRSEEFRYDAAGNLLKQPGLSDVHLASGNRLASANGETFQYDRRNHVSRRANGATATEYRYDSRDMLVAMENGGEDWAADYDPMGRRIRKSVGDQATEYYWDTDRLAAEVSGSGALRVYVYPDAFSIVPMMFVDYEDVEAEPGSGKRYFVFCNHLSTPVRVEDEQGEVVWSAQVDPYGRTEVDRSSVIELALRLPGHYQDAETGLHYNRFRYYDPVLGRYLQSDPIGVPGGLNVYAYGTPNPLRSLDVRGTCGGGADGDDDDGDDSSNEGDDAEQRPTAAERLAARRRQQREQRRQEALDEAIAKADAEGRLDDLDPADRTWLESDRRHKELAIDLDGDGSYRVNEARDALQAEQDNQLTYPVRRATREADPGEAGADIIDGDDRLWDHKDQSMGADDIADTAAPPRGDPENVIVGSGDLTDAEQSALESDVDDRVRRSGRDDAGDVIFVPKRD